MSLPLVLEIPFTDPAEFFYPFSTEKGAIFLDSAALRRGCGRYSFIAVRPFQTLQSKNKMVHIDDQPITGNPFDILQTTLRQFCTETLPGLPPFQGGAAGYLGYELFQHLEKIPTAPIDDMTFPDMALGFYDLVVAFDTLLKKTWIFSSGFPQTNPHSRLKQATSRLNTLLQDINSPLRIPPSLPADGIKTRITSNFTKASYMDAVQRVKNYILNGDIFEANISQRFSATLDAKHFSFDLYRRLRRINPAPFSAFLHFPDVTLASASPERFISLQAGKVEARPIKGTRPRGDTKDADETFARSLLSSEKDYAENVMIVDLLRNDISRVCELHSVNVTQLCGLETYPALHHLVSVIQGQLRQHYSAIDLLKATFPGGSITGAPKIRAMEIISEIEPTQRGPYCGSIGWMGFDGNMDLSITIRTFCIRNNRITFQAGGAIVLDSCPEQEYLESKLKAHALLCALTGDSA